MVVVAWMCEFGLGWSSLVWSGDPFVIVCLSVCKIHCFIIDGILKQNNGFTISTHPFLHCAPATNNPDPIPHPTLTNPRNSHLRPPPPQRTPPSNSTTHQAPSPSGTCAASSPHTPPPHPYRSRASPATGSPSLASSGTPPTSP